MAAVAERYASYVSAFEAFRRDPMFGSGERAARREAAFGRFLDRGFPTTRDEEWKFTSVAPVAALEMQRAPAAHASADVLAPWDFANTFRIVLVNGRQTPAGSSPGAPPPGVTIRHGAPPPEPERVKGRLNRPAAPASAFTELNTAFAGDALVIEVAPGTIVREAIHVVSIAVGSGAPVLIAPAIDLRVGEGAQVVFVETYGSAGDAVTLTTARTIVTLAPSAIVDHVKIQRESMQAFHVADLSAALDRASTFTSRAITFGGRIARNDIGAFLHGEGAECTLSGLYLATGDRLVDTHTTIEHQAPHCPSHEVYKGILAGRARAVFNGKIVVDPLAQKTNAKQTNKALLLSDEAQINSKPQLEIFADDVKCTHGAAIGQLDEDALFYLRARGIGEAAARHLLIGAFAGEILNGISVEPARAFVARELDAVLSGTR